MATIDSLKMLLIDQLRDIYDAEKRLTKAIPKLAKNATDARLQAALEDHLRQTEQHVARLESAFEQFDEEPKGKTCAAMKGLIDEGDETAGAHYEYDSLRDAAIIGAAQRVEHYEIAAYGTAMAFAKLLELPDVLSLLGATIAEEKEANRKLNDLAEQDINRAALSASSAQFEGDEEGEEEEEDEVEDEHGIGAPSPSDRPRH